MVSTRNLFCLFSLCLVIVCFLPVVIRLTSSRVKKDFTLVFKAVIILLVGNFFKVQTFSPTTRLRRFFEKPSAFSANPSSLYFFTIRPTATFEISCFYFYFLAFWYLLLISAINAS